jgi:hypothetical protein
MDRRISFLGHGSIFGMGSAINGVQHLQEFEIPPRNDHVDGLGICLGNSSQFLYIIYILEFVR